MYCLTSAGTSTLSINRAVSGLTCLVDLAETAAVDSTRSVVSEALGLSIRFTTRSGNIGCGLTEIRPDNPCGQTPYTPKSMVERMTPSLGVGAEPETWMYCCN